MKHVYAGVILLIRMWFENEMMLQMILSYSKTDK